MEKEQAIALWNDKGIVRAEMEFYCGGDEMGDYSFVYFNADDEVVECCDLDDFFDRVVFDRVEFYVNSDGHYMGESGTVHIELEDDEEYGEEIDFTYSKSAQSEWQESITNTINIHLTDEQIEYLKEYVSSFNGGSDENVNFNYSKDFIMTDEHDRIEKEIATILEETTNDYEPETDNELNEWYNFQNEEPMFNEHNELLVEMNNEVYVYTDSED
jgi:hypothetical protein